MTIQYNLDYVNGYRTKESALRKPSKIDLDHPLKWNKSELMNSNHISSILHQQVEFQRKAIVHQQKVYEELRESISMQQTMYNTFISQIIKYSNSDTERKPFHNGNTPVNKTSDSVHDLKNIIIEPQISNDYRNTSMDAMEPCNKINTKSQDENIRNNKGDEEILYNSNSISSTLKQMQNQINLHRRMLYRQEGQREMYKINAVESPDFDQKSITFSPSKLPSRVEGSILSDSHSLTLSVHPSPLLVNASKNQTYSSDKHGRSNRSASNTNLSEFEFPEDDLFDFLLDK